MRRLTDGEIVPNYTQTATNTLDSGEELNCGRCAKRSAEPGAQTHLWNRPPKKATSLPVSIELCDVCDRQVRQLKSNEPQ
jgi:hypothetical protein